MLRLRDMQTTLLECHHLHRDVSCHGYHHTQLMNLYFTKCCQCQFHAMILISNGVNHTFCSQWPFALPVDALSSTGNLRISASIFWIRFPSGSYSYILSSPHFRTYTVSSDIPNLMSWNLLRSSFVRVASSAIDPAYWPTSIICQVHFLFDRPSTSQPDQY